MADALPPRRFRPQFQAKILLLALKVIQDPLVLRRQILLIGAIVWLGDARHMFGCSLHIGVMMRAAAIENIGLIAEVANGLATACRDKQSGIPPKICNQLRVTLTVSLVANLGRRQKIHV